METTMAKAKAKAMRMNGAQEEEAGMTIVSSTGQLQPQQV
jgi:hypothetical protein